VVEKLCFKDRADKGAKCAVKVKRELTRLTRSFKLKRTHRTVEKGYDEAYKDKHEQLDYYVLCSGKRIAMLDVSSVGYQLLDYNAPRYSRIMPVAQYKGVIAKANSLPVFIVYHMSFEEDYGLPFRNRCMWIKGEHVYIGSDRPPEGAPWPELALNYYTELKHWHRGLDGLVKEFRRVVKNETQV
jgi:hypothetical protein